MRILLFIALISLTPLNAAIAQDYWYEQETIPIPRKRPNILSVSPAYIEYLKNRDAPKKEYYEFDVSTIEPAAGEEFFDPTIQDEDDIELKKEQIRDVSSLDVLKMLEDPQGTQEPEIVPPPMPNQKYASINETIYDEQPQEFIPIPAHKPGSISQLQNAYIQDEILQEEPKIQPVETRLVSFTLPPEEVKLDKNLEKFLKDHALNLFQENRNLKLDIQAFASTSNEQEYSDVRISLARALEVRRYLLDHNVEPSRLKLSPRGEDKENNTDDRIDLVFIDMP